VAALTERAKVTQPVVGRITVQVCGRKHDACRSKSDCLDKIGPTSRTTTAVAPCCRFLVEPAPVRQAAEQGQVWSAAALAPSSGTLDADAAAQLAPVRRVKRAQFGADWHGGFSHVKGYLRAEAEGGKGTLSRWSLDPDSAPPQVEKISPNEKDFMSLLFAPVAGSNECQRLGHDRPGTITPAAAGPLLERSTPAACARCRSNTWRSPSVEKHM
jgi:hypothetical protein